MKFLTLAASLLALPPLTPPPAAPDIVYGTSRAALYQRLRVREVWVEQTDFQGGYGGRATPRHLASYEQLDRAGRVQREERADANGYVLTQAREYDYDAKGEVTDLSEFTRIAWPAGNQPDTSRTGLGWLPYTHTRYPTAARPTGLKVYWHQEEEEWEPLEKWDRWHMHDTTYARIVDVRSGSATLERRYRAGAQRELQRTDYLHFVGPILAAANYYYAREEKGRVVETGQLGFGDEQAAYLAAHPAEQARSQQSNPAALQAYDAMARRGVGVPQPDFIDTYSPRGQLVQRLRPESGLLVTYRRDARGRLLGSQDNSPRRARTCTYAYLPNGLLASCETTDQLGVRVQSQRYRYRYY